MRFFNRYGKLNRIKSIAIAGVMTVSLLTGCSTSGNDTSDSHTSGNDEANTGAVEPVADITEPVDEVNVVITQQQDSDVCELGDEYTFNVADFFTAEGITVDALNVDLSAVNTAECGEYAITVTYEDSYEAVVNLSVIDTIPPSISIGNDTLFVNSTDEDVLRDGFQIQADDLQDCDIVFSEYCRFGDYDVLDDYSEDELESRLCDYAFEYHYVEDADSEDADSEGFYVLGIQAVDKSGNRTEAFGKFYYDITPAVISGLRDQTVYQEDLSIPPTYSVSSVTIKDNLDGDIDVSDASVTLEVKNEANHTYTLSVSYTDRAGNVSIKQATITVLEPAPPEPEPVEPAPSEPVPSEPEPVEPAPSEPAPSEPAPSEPAPSEPEPVESAPVAGVSDYAQRILELVNIHRANAGLAPLTLNAELCSNANVRAVEIVNCFDHTRPDGNPFYTAITVSYWCAGENIAAGFITPEEVVEGWMNSPGHRANILYPDYTQLGIGYYYDPGSYYTYHWVQLFAG